MYRILSTYEGLTHMMHHRFADASALDKPPTRKAKGWTKKGVHELLHCDEKGVFVPADNLRQMLIGNKFRTGACKIQGSFIEKGKGAEYIQMAKSCIWVLGPEDIDKVYLDPIRKTFDEIDHRPIANAGGSRSMAHRPVLTLPWSLTFLIEVMDDLIDQSKVRQFYDTGGMRCGIGAYGPKFGRARITQWEVTAD